MHGVQSRLTPRVAWRANPTATPLYFFPRGIRPLNPTASCKSACYYTFSCADAVALTRGEKIRAWPGLGPPRARTRPRRARGARPCTTRRRADARGLAGGVSRAASRGNRARPVGVELMSAAARRVVVDARVRGQARGIVLQGPVSSNTAAGARAPHSRAARVAVRRRAASARMRRAPLFRYPRAPGPLVMLRSSAASCTGAPRRSAAARIVCRDFRR